jgi:nuclease-like protein
LLANRSGLVPELVLVALMPPATDQEDVLPRSHAPGSLSKTAAVVSLVASSRAARWGYAADTSLHRTGSITVRRLLAEEATPSASVGMLPCVRTIRLRWWEALLLVLPVLLSGLFFLGHDWVPGLLLLSLVVIIVTSRAQIIERNVAGGFARTRAALLFSKAAALFTIYCVVTALLILGRFQDWTDDTPGTVASYALAGLAFYLFLHMRRVGDEAERWLRGGDMEARVARELDPLRDSGWVVTHDLKREHGGNVDHFVHGPHGAFVIETKSGKPRAADRGQALSNAVWAKSKFGERWVTAILCVAQEAPPVPLPVRHGNATVWLMGPDQLRPWLVSQAEADSVARR